MFWFPPFWRVDEVEEVVDGLVVLETSGSLPVELSGALIPWESELEDGTLAVVDVLGDVVGARVGDVVSLVMGSTKAVESVEERDSDEDDEDEEEKGSTPRPHSAG